MVPPNDDLFDGATPATDAVADAPATDVATPAALSAADIDQRIAIATAPLTERTTSLQRENEALRLAIQQSQQPAPPATPSGDDFVASFNRDPAAAVRAIAEQSSSEGLKQLAPHLNTLITSANEAFLGAQQTRIESEFGTKAWDEVYRPALAARFDAIRRENPFAVADINRVRMEVDLITGSNFSKVSGLRDEHLKGRTTASEAERTKLIEDARRGITTNLTGGIRANSKGTLPELDPDMKAAIADMDRHTGQRTNTAEWTKNMIAAQNSKDIDEWIAATKAPAGRAH